MSVRQQGNFGEKVSAMGPVLIGYDVSVHGLTALMNGVSCMGGLNTRGQNVLHDSVAVGGMFDVNAPSYLKDNVSIYGILSMDGTADLSGSMSIGEALAVHSSCSVGSDTLIDGQVCALLGFITERDIDCGGHLSVGGFADIHGTLTLNESSRMLSDSKLLGRLDVESFSLFEGPVQILDTCSIGRIVNMGDMLSVSEGVDVGANVGTTSIEMLECSHSVYSFECHPVTFKKL
jgi:hypothetical protein